MSQLQEEIYRVFEEALQKAGGNCAEKLASELNKIGPTGPDSVPDWRFTRTYEPETQTLRLWFSFQISPARSRKTGNLSDILADLLQVSSAENLREWKKSTDMLRECVPPFALNSSPALLIAEQTGACMFSLTASAPYDLTGNV